MSADSGYRLSPAARNDLDDIWNYTVRVWGLVQAERYILSIREVCEALAGGRRQGEPIDHIRHGYRKISVGSHVVLYRLDEPGRIDVIRILHQRMDTAGKLQAR
jgi:toxin ParE1/3/4